MARTANPNKRLDDFKVAIAESASRHARIDAALVAAGESDAVKKGAAEDAAFRLGVLWEIFQGDWHVAAISQDPSVFRGTMLGKLNAAVKDTWARGVIEAVSPGALTLAQHPSVSLILKMLDPQDFNVTFADAKAWKKDADKHLGPKHTARVNAVVSDNEASSFLHLVKKMRNHLAHGSTGSKDQFNVAARARVGSARIGLVGTANEPLQRDARGVSDLGKYLRAVPSGGGPVRIQVMHTRLESVAELLRVP